VAKRFSDLTNAERDASYSEVEAEIRSILSAISHEVSPSDQHQILEYLNHNELGVALEHLCDTLIEDATWLRDREFSRISSLFERMEMTPSDRLKTLASRVHR
jgi:hypothetical protein